MHIATYKQQSDCHFDLVATRKRQQWEETTLDHIENNLKERGENDDMLDWDHRDACLTIIESVKNSLWNWL